MCKGSNISPFILMLRKTLGYDQWGDFLAHIQISRKINTKFMILWNEMAYNEMISS